MDGGRTRKNEGEEEGGLSALQNKITETAGYSWLLHRFVWRRGGTGGLKQIMETKCKNAKNNPQEKILPH